MDLFCEGNTQVRGHRRPMLQDSILRRSKEQENKKLGEEDAPNFKLEQAINDCCSFFKSNKEWKART